MKKAKKRKQMLSKAKVVDPNVDNIDKIIEQLLEEKVKLLEQRNEIQEKLIDKLEQKIALYQRIVDIYERENNRKEEKN